LNELRRKYQSLEVWVLDKVSHEKIMELHKESWVLIIPSITEEPLPYAVAEAMALGTIPLASSVGGITEIVDDCLQKKFLFKPGNIYDLIEKLKIFTLRSKENILSLAMECRNHIMKIFSKENIERKIFEAFKKL
jgi:glycosyltransferase involved in cell wall biosynthesis